MVTRAAFISGLLAIVALALYPDLKLPEHRLTAGGTDFFWHILAFFMLTFGARVIWASGAVVALVMVLLAVSLEFLQYFVPGRGVFLSDVVASLTGVALGFATLRATSVIRRWWAGAT